MFTPGARRPTRNAASEGTFVRLGYLVLLFLAHAIGTANITLVLAMSPALERDLALSHSEFGLLVSAYFTGVVICTFPAGWAVDRFGIRSALIGAHSLMALGALLLSASQSFVQAVGALALSGVGYSLVNPSTARGVLLWFSHRRRGLAMGVKQTGVPAGGVLAALLVAFAGDNWRELVTGFAAAMLIASVIFAPLRAQSAAPPSQVALGGAVKLLSRHVFAMFNFGACLYATVQGGVFAYLVLYLHQARKLELAIASLCLGMAHFGSAAGRIGWGFLSDLRIFDGRLNALAACGLVGAVAAFLLLKVPIESGPLVPISIAALVGFSIGGYAGIVQTAAVEIVETQWAGTSIAYSVLLATVGSLLGPVIIGASIDFFGYMASWIGTAALLMLGAILFHMTNRKNRPVRELVV